LKVHWLSVLFSRDIRNQSIWITFKECSFVLRFWPHQIFWNQFPVFRRFSLIKVRRSSKNSSRVTQGSPKIRIKIKENKWLLLNLMSKLSSDNLKEEELSLTLTSQRKSQMLLVVILKDMMISSEISRKISIQKSTNLQASQMQFMLKLLSRSITTISSSKLWWSTEQRRLYQTLISNFSPKETLKWWKSQ